MVKRTKQTAVARLEKLENELNEWRWPRALGDMPRVIPTTGEVLSDRDVIRVAYTVVCRIRRILKQCKSLDVPLALGMVLALVAAVVAVALSA